MTNDSNNQLLQPIIMMTNYDSNTVCASSLRRESVLIASMKNLLAHAHSQIAALMLSLAQTAVASGRYILFLG